MRRWEGRKEWKGARADCAEEVLQPVMETNGRPGHCGATWSPSAPMRGVCSDCPWGLGQGLDEQEKT